MKSILNSSVIGFALALAVPVTTLIATPAIAAATVSDGAFKGAGGSYRSSGTATLARNDNGSHSLKFANFSVTQGPNLRVWLIKGNARNSAAVKGADYIELGALKSNRGAQQYSVPQSAIDQGYTTVVIWCEPFGVLFASAKLA